MQGTGERWTLRHAPVLDAVWTAPKWLVPLSIFAVTQAVAFLAFASASGGVTADVTDRWDGTDYRWIAREGYVTQATSQADAPVFAGLWAFYPLYPMAVRSVMVGTALGWDAAAALVSLAAGAVAVTVLHRMLSRHVSRAAATVAVLMLCTWMAAPVMQMAYTESLALMLLVCAFDFLDQQRYGALIVTVLLLGLCRPIAIPFAAVMAAHVVVLWRQHASRPHLLRALAATVGCFVAALLWPALAGLISGRTTAYFDAMAAFSQPGAPRSWLFWAVGLGPAGWVVAAAVCAVLIWTALRLIDGPLELRVWAVVYPLYVLAATYMSGSVVRYLLLAFPLALVWAPLAEKGQGGRVVLGALAMSGVCLSVFWVHHFVAGTAGPIP